MTPHDIEALVDALDQTMSMGGHGAVADFIKLSTFSEAPSEITAHTRFESVAKTATEHLFAFHHAFPLEYVKIPPQSIDDAMPDGWTFDDLAPTFEKLKAASEAGALLEEVELPEGISTEQMSATWDALKLYFDSGAVLRRETQRNKEAARLRIEENGLKDVLVVLDEDYRVISGLSEVWALSEMSEHDNVPAVILKDMPQDAGWLHTHASAGSWGAKLPPKLNTVREAFDSASPREREFFGKFGFTPVPTDKIELCGSRETMKRLGELILKQVGYGTKFDPAQLLYVEALREEITAARQRELDPLNDPGNAEKLQRHLTEEAEAEEAGRQALAGKEKWIPLGDDLYGHSKLPRHVFRLIEAEPEEITRTESIPVDPYLMEQSQFVIFAKAHFGLASDEAQALHADGGAERFNRRLRHYIDATPSNYVKLKKTRELDKTKAPQRMELSEQTERLERWRSVS